MNQERKHILVTGSNRSGTTWVGEMLHASGETNYVYEPFGRRFFALKVDCPLQHHFHYVTEEESSSVREYIDCCLSPLNTSWCKGFKHRRTHRGFTRHGLVRTVKDVILESMRTMGQLYRASNFKSRFIIKDPLALFSAPWLYQEYDCHVIVLIRHPAAYVDSIKRVSWRHDPSSYLKQPALMKKYLQRLEKEIVEFRQNDDNILEEATLRWKIYHEVIRIFRESFPWVFVRHEDLSRDPVNAFRRLYEDCDLSFSERAKKAILKSTTGPSSDLGTTCHVLRRDSKKSIRKWKTNLAHEDIEYIRVSTNGIAAEFYSNEDW